MRPDIATIKKWHDRHQRQPRESIDERFHRPQYRVNGVTAVARSATQGFTSASILGILTYTPGGNQGNCGLSSISATTITTSALSVSQSKAISNIKNLFNQGKLEVVYVLT